MLYATGIIHAGIAASSSPVTDWASGAPSSVGIAAPVSILHLPGASLTILLIRLDMPGPSRSAARFFSPVTMP